jgi:hypothetical protein
MSSNEAFGIETIQGVPVGKVNIPGGHSIGHSKQKSVYVHVSYSERFPSRTISLYSSKIVGKKPT